MPNYKRYAALGDDLVLTMKYSGYPYPDLQWTHAFRDVTAKSSNTMKRSELRLTNISVSDFGIYNLVMNNSLGSSMVTYEVIARGKNCEFNYSIFPQLYFINGFTKNCNPYSVSTLVLNTCSLDIRNPELEL